MKRYRIGISGWTYPPWRGVFFPERWPQKRELEFASRHVNSIEINGTFYSLQRPSSYRAWYDATPDDFVFSVKGGRFITHLKRLKDVEKPLANFFASGVLCLREKLGPFLWQLPPSYRFDPDRLRHFFELLPRDTVAPAKLARRHDGKVSGRAALKPDERRPLRHAIEVRHSSFENPDFIKLLCDQDIAVVVADTAGKWPYMEDVTSDFVYVRLHGDEEIYVSGYTYTALDEWARRIRTWARGGNSARKKRTAPPLSKCQDGREVYVYFDNDVKVRAPFDAMSLAQRLGMKWKVEPLEDKLAKVEEEARQKWPEIQRRRGRHNDV